MKAESESRPDDAVKLYLQALDCIKGQPALASPLDVERLRRIRDAITSVVTIQAGDSVQSARDLRAGKQFANVWTYGGGSSGNGIDVGWTNDVLIAAKAASGVTSLPLEARPRSVIVDAGHLKIIGAPNVPLNELVSSLRSGTNALSVLTQWP
jgi:hypothetical protein